MRFLSLPNASRDTADVLILPVPHERTVTYGPGTAGGPEAVLAASNQLEFYEEDMGWCPTMHLKLCVLDELAAKVGEEDAAFHARMLESVGMLKTDALLIALGGEHSITPELVFSRMPEGGTVVQIDARADLRPSYQGSIYNHACPMHRLRERGCELVQIGIRSLHAREAARISEDQGIAPYFDRTLRCPGAWENLIRHLSALEGPLWLTIDMDGFNPALVSGVGTPQPGGLGWHQGLDIPETLFGNSGIDLRGMDVVELVPDPSGVSEMTAAKLVQKAMSYCGKAQGFDRRPAVGSQLGVQDD
jgi:agmatinase